MFFLYADKNKLTVQQREPVTSGSVNVYPVRFEFSSDWDNLTRTACFQSGEVSASVLLDIAGECNIPWEVLQTPGQRLSIGVYGTCGDDIALPTIWVNCGTVLPGATAGTLSQPPTPGIYEQLLEQLQKKADSLDYDGTFLSLLSGNKPLSSVPIIGGSMTEGTMDHRILEHRDAADQHPIEAISGLEEISNLELLKIWNGE